ENHIDELLDLLEKNPLKLLPNTEMTGPKCFVLVGDADITSLIRTPEVGNAASIVGAYPEIRKVVREHERRIVESHKAGVIVEGRDSGTVVFPEAEIKFFLTAAPEVRARRRYEEYIVSGKEIPFENVLAEIVERDERDTSREYSALRIPVDAIVVDSTDYTVDQTHAELRKYIDKKLKEMGVLAS